MPIDDKPSDSVVKTSRNEGRLKPMDFLQKNHLIYRMPAELNVTNTRRLIRNYAEKKVYSSTGGIASIILNNGDAMVDGRNSYITFKIVKKSIGALGRSSSWGSGSALNIIRAVTITTASGVEVDRIDNVNMVYYDWLKYTKSNDWKVSVGSLMGYGEAVSQHNNSLNDNISEAYVIPLRYINGLFSVNKLLYSGLMSGLKIELEFENIDTAFDSTTGYLSTDTYEIHDLSIMCDCHVLSDFAMKELHEASSSNDGLELMFPTFDRQTGNLPTSLTILNAQTNKAVTRANMAWLKVRPSAKVGSGQVPAEADSFLSEAVTFTKRFQFNLGSLYFPNQALDQKREFYANSVYVFGQLKGDKLLQVNTASFDADSAIYTALLEKSDILENSGMPLVSGRSLAVSAEFNSGVDRRTDIIVQYTKLLKMFVSNVVVKQ